MSGKATGWGKWKSMAATIAACYAATRAVPAELMRPRAPKAGKRILLERIGIIWSHLNFSKKATFRNLFRYKKRFFMGGTLEDAGTKYNAFVEALQSAYNTVKQNRAELAPQTSQAAVNEINSEEASSNYPADEDDE